MSSDKKHTVNHGIEAAEKMQQKCIEKYGWYLHHVTDDSFCPNNTNSHTHHLTESFGHKDFQVCLNIRPDIIHAILTNLVEEIKKGAKYEVGKKYDGILTGYQVEFIDAIETGREVLRLLLPDENGKYEHSPYSDQLTKLNNRVIVHNPN